MNKLTYTILLLLIENRQPILDFILSKIDRRKNTKSETVLELEKLRDSYTKDSVDYLEIQNVIDKLKGDK